MCTEIVCTQPVSPHVLQKEDFLTKIYLYCIGSAKKMQLCIFKYSICITFNFRDEEREKEDLGAKQLAAMAAAEKLSSSKSAKAEPSPFARIDFAALSNKMVSFLARNFFTLKLIALVIAFTINFMLLFYKVSEVEGEDGGDDDLGPEVIDVGSADDGGEGKILI